MIFFQLRGLPLRAAKLVRSYPQYVQKANITGRNTRGSPLCLPKPFPYKDKPYYWFYSIFDSTILRLAHENAKIIVVEGPIGVGKSAFAKVLAEQFDMLYMPQPSMDYFYVLPSGYDLRQHDHELPEVLQSFYYQNLCVEPKSARTANFLYRMLYLKFLQYADALCHVMNTGQGVVLERSYYSDFVFTKALYENKFISRDVRDMYAEVLKNTSTFFLAPHLVVYLDIPVPVVQERIRTRNYSYEQNSPLLTKGFLTSLEKFWKEDYLLRAVKNSEVLIYDWTDGGDVDVVIDDIEKIDFDVLRRDNRFIEWRVPRKRLNGLRQEYTNNIKDLMPYFYIKDYAIPEMNIPSHVCLQWDKLMSKIPELKYDKGYNYHAGDKIFNIMFKSNFENHRDLRFHLHYFDKWADFV